jgi:hypothetical protein
MVPFPLRTDACAVGAATAEQPEQAVADDRLVLDQPREEVGVEEFLAPEGEGVQQVRLEFLNELVDFADRVVVAHRRLLR